MKLVILLLSAAGFFSVFGKDIFVDSSALGNGNGSSWNNASTNLQNALAFSSSGDRILLASGIYYPDQGSESIPGDRALSFSIPSGISILGGFPEGGGSEAEREPLDHQAILSGDLLRNDNSNSDTFSDNSFQIVKISGGEDKISIDGVIFQSGYGLDATETTSQKGAGLTCDTSVVELKNCVFRNCFSKSGAAAYFFNSKITIQKCLFEENQGSYGGACYIRNSQVGSVIESTTFERNRALQSGGSIFLYSSGLKLDRCRILESHSETHGGAIYCDFASYPEFESCEFKGNQAQFGGAISSADRSSPRLINSIFQGNLADYGGALDALTG